HRCQRARLLGLPGLPSRIHRRLRTRRRSRHPRRRRGQPVTTPHAADRHEQGRHHPPGHDARARLRSHAQLLRSATRRPPLRHLRQLRAARERLPRSRDGRPSSHGLRSRHPVQILRERPLRRQVAVVTLSVLIPLILSAAWSASVTRPEREAEVRDQATSIAATAGAYLNQYLAGLDSMASALVRPQSVVALDSAACNRLFAEVLRAQPLVLNIILSDVAG